MNRTETYQLFNLVESPLSGTNLIEASAGTGKTFNIAGLYLRLILEKELEVDQVVVVTFTEAATGELRDRIRGRLAEAYRYLAGHEVELSPSEVLLPALKEKFENDTRKIRNLKVAVNDFDRAAIFTIHGFCQRMLREYAFESSSLFDTELTTDETMLTGEIVDDYFRSRVNELAWPLVEKMQGRNGFTPGKAHALLKKRSIDPGFTIEPGLPLADKEELENAYNEIVRYYTRARESWMTHRQEAIDLIAAAIDRGALNRNSYKHDNFTSKTGSIDAYFSGGIPLNGHDSIDYCTATTLDKRKKAGHEPPQHAVFDELDMLKSTIDSFIPILEEQVTAVKADFLGFAEEEIPRRKEQKNLRTFDDILKDMYTALQGGPESLLARAVRRKFRAALIDEFQDTDPVQYRIFTTIFNYRGHILYLIGDPKQAIYGFRGADIFAYLKATAEVSSMYTLGTNWRSDPGLVRAVNAIFSRRQQPFIFTKIQYPEVRSYPDAKDALEIDGEDPASLVVWMLDERYSKDNKKPVTKGEAEGVIKNAVAIEISRLAALGREGKALIDGKPVTPGDMAVLVRTHRQANMIRQGLAGFNVPAVVYSTGSVLDTEEAWQLALVLQAAADPAGETRVRTALATSIMGCNAETIFNLKDDDAAWDGWMEKFILYNERWKKRGFMGMFRLILEENDTASRLLEMDNGERRYTDLLHCAEIVQRVEREQAPGIEGLLNWYLEQVSGGSGEEEYTIRLETDDIAVKIITLHRSKGLQFPIVFCPFLYDGVDVKGEFSFHDPSRNDSLTLDISTNKESDNHTLAEYEELAEQVRLFYVGLTRAKHRCYMAWGKVNSFEASGPGYLLHYDGSVKRGESLADMKNSISSISYNEIQEQVLKVQNASDGAINVVPIPGSGGKRYVADKVKPSLLQKRNFTGTIPSDWKIASYSSLSSRHGDVTARDMDRDIFLTASPSLVKTGSFLDFPRGTRTGLCVHRIFEELDFTESGQWEPVIRDILAGYGFDESWKPAVTDMVENVLQAGLETGDQTLQLSTVQNSDRINEMEFYFPAEKINAEGLAKVFEKGGIFLSRFKEMVRSLEFSPVKGYVRGFIDLVFRHGERYYIVDWKTNWLGNNLEDYSRPMLEKAMEEHLYVLQYYLYSVALHRYLRARVRGYRYDKHFGGVFYLFLRGIDEKEGSRYGIYHDRPQQEMMDTLDGYFSHGNA